MRVTVLYVSLSWTFITATMFLLASVKCVLWPAVQDTRTKNRGGFVDDTHFFFERAVCPECRDDTFLEDLHFCTNCDYGAPHPSDQEHSPSPPPDFQVSKQSSQSPRRSYNQGKASLEREQTHLLHQEVRRERNRSQKNNLESAKRAQKRWRANNPERVKVNRKRWREENPNTLKMVRQRWRKNHREHTREADRLYRQKNIERLREKGRQHGRRRQERIRQSKQSKAIDSQGKDSSHDSGDKRSGDQDSGPKTG